MGQLLQIPGERMTRHAGTIECMFCSCVISLRNGDDQKFKKHLEVYHEVFSYFDILLAIHFLRQEETQNILEEVKYRIQEVMDTGAQVKQEMMNILEEDFDIPYKHEEQNNDVGDEALEKENILNEGPNRHQIKEKFNQDVNVEESQPEESKSENNVSDFNGTGSEEKNEENPKSRIKKKYNCEICHRTFKDLRKHVMNKGCLRY